MSPAPQSSPTPNSNVVEDLLESTLDGLRSRANPENVQGMAHYGINPEGTLGVSMVSLREMARDRKKPLAPIRHELAERLWGSGIHEARILAALVDVPALVSDAQMERWVQDFDSWDVCDQVCSNLFDRTPFAVQKAIDWAGRRETFVKRAGFVLMAALAVHAKQLPDATFESFLPVIEREAGDDRNFVRKAVNWALRQIGKRNLALNRRAIAAAEHIQRMEIKSARWVASDALRELNSPAVLARLKGVGDRGF